MNLTELSIETSQFTKNEKLVGQLTEALRTEGVILALQVVKNVAGATIQSNSDVALGMLKAISLIQSLATIVPPPLEFDPKKHVILEGFGQVDLDIFPEELRNEPEPPK